MARHAVKLVQYAIFIVVASSAFLSRQVEASVRAGVGYSSVTSGRTIPALALGLTVNQNWALSAMLAGAHTPVYYTSGVMMNGLWTKDWGDFVFGRLEVGFGGGVYHGEKGIYKSVDSQGKPSDLVKDQDNVIGPAFRVAYKPWKYVHVSVEFLMGFGTSLISNAWQDVGLGSVGVDL